MTSTTDPQTTTASFATPTVHCGSCMATITEALEVEEGVVATGTDLSTKSVQVTFDPTRTDTDRIAAAITDAGYEVTDTTA